MGKNKTNDPFFNLADALVEDIIAASDEDLLSESAQDLKDPFALSNKFDEIIARGAAPKSPVGGSGSDFNSRAQRGELVIDLKRYSESGSSRQKLYDGPIFDAMEMSPLDRKYEIASLDHSSKVTPINRTIQRAKPQATSQWFKIAAALVVGVGLGFAGDLSLRKDGGQDWRQAAANYQALYVTETLALTTAVADEERQKRLWQSEGVPASRGINPEAGRNASLDKQRSSIAAVSAKLGLPITPEALQAPGLELKRAQLLQFDGRPLAQFAYLDAEGAPIAFWATHTGSADSPAKTGSYDKLAAVSWNKGGYGFMVIGAAPIAEIERAASSLAAQI